MWHNIESSRQESLTCSATKGCTADPEAQLQCTQLGMAKQIHEVNEQLTDLDCEVLESVADKGKAV